MDGLAAAFVASLMDFDETDLMPMECTTCGHRCANRIESMVHTKETGHPSFSQKVRGGQGRNDRTPNPMACRTCGHMCANRAESWEHTEATGHTGFKARKSMADQLGNRKQGSYKVGDQVTALRRITHQGADVRPGTQGTVQQIDPDGDIHIKWDDGYMNCGLQPGDFKLHSVGAADASGQIRVGSLVMVKEEVKNPTYNWGAVSPGDCGTVSRILGDGRVKVDFPAQSDWTGKMQELRLARRGDTKDASGQIRVGSLVMVKEEVKNPTYNWGAVSPGDCGTVSRILGDGRVKVDFPAQSDWTGKMHELRLVQTSDTQEKTVRVLYHQTSPEAAEKILRTQRMHRGSSGLAGGGIYFAETKEATNPKAHHHGVILQARVDLGRIKEVRSSAQSMTFTALRAEGYDSVKILGRASGTEYVVYNWDQVTDIRKVSS